ncbi:hypothetical protein [Spirosoma montaniterrae]|uniref:Uncharacterized protein n=1 Tax=Spirosoma montaniterrae TaxID=1178516 RepID=A0A1P9WYQ0_9BACT|nr:hypothetical protein [Spirosoma montaniterrae]AQG80511.1 hypothetical protein AWR27_14980 [Spirosoma montaniterrae]
MNPRFLTAVILFVSAYSPLFTILIIKDFDFKYDSFKHPNIAYTSIGLVALSIALLFYSVNSIKAGNTVFKINSVKARSGEFINYTVPYLLSFFGENLDDLGDVLSLGIFLTTILVITIRSKSVFINPVLAFAGYGLYDVDYTYDGKVFSTTVLSKLDIETDKIYYVRMISKFLFFIVKRHDGRPAQQP